MHPSSLFHLLNDAHCHSVPSLTVSYLILFKVPVSNTSVVVDLAAPVVMVYKHNFSLPSPCFLPESQFSWFLNKISSLSPSLSYCCSSSSAVWQRNEEDKEILKQVLDIVEDRRKVAGVKNEWMNEWMNEKYWFMPEERNYSAYSFIETESFQTKTTRHSCLVF